jgi:hypothetical protein
MGKMFRTRPGAERVFFTGLAVSVLGWVCLFIAFASPYWFVTWPRVFNNFRRLGLWEVCSSGLLSYADKDQVSYFGCWWIFAPYYKDIRSWLMPWWFIITQIVFSFAFLFECLKIIFEIVILARVVSNDEPSNSSIGTVKFLSRFNIAVDVIFGILKSATVILFGIAAYYDRNWMPNYELNYLGWSYGLAICSCFMSIFACFPNSAFARFATKAEPLGTQGKAALKI